MSSNGWVAVSILGFMFVVIVVALLICVNAEAIEQAEKNAKAEEDAKRRKERFEQIRRQRSQ